MTKAQDEKIITDDLELENNDKDENDEKETERIGELSKKKDITEDEQKELDGLKKERSTRYQKRINELTWKAKSASEELEKERREKEELQKQLEDSKNKNDKPSRVDINSAANETMKIGNTEWFTDNALTAMVNSEQITMQEAYTYQRKRDKEEMKLELRQERENEDKKEEANRLREEDKEWVRKNFPHFDPRNANFNPEDPIYKLANELFMEGYAANPKGLSMAIKRAKQILRIPDSAPDRTDDLSVHSSGSPERKAEKDQDVVLTDEQKESAVRMWCKGDYINPKTGRPYTEKEAVEKMKAAIKARRK